jgi:hypothetical protein
LLGQGGRPDPDVAEIRTQIFGRDHVTAVERPAADEPAAAASIVP